MRNNVKATKCSSQVQNIYSSKHQVRLQKYFSARDEAQPNYQLKRLYICGLLLNKSNINGNQFVISPKSVILGTMPVPNPISIICQRKFLYRTPSCAEVDMKQSRLSFNIKVLKRADYNLPWMKAGSQNTKQAIRMLLWQDIAVLCGTAVLLLRLTWSYFSIDHALNISVIYIVSSVY